MSAIRILCSLFFVCCGVTNALELSPIPFDPEMETIVEDWGYMYDDETIVAGCHMLDPERPVIPPKKNSPYEYKWLDLEKYGVEKIKAVNQTGGRSYIYDLRWKTAYYIFRTTDEANEIGGLVIQWMANDLSEGKKKQLLISLGWRGLYADTQYKNRAFVDVLETVGCFMGSEQNRSDIWSAIHNKGGWLKDDEKIICLRSIISLYDTYSDDVKHEVDNNIRKFIENRPELINFGFMGKIRDWLKTKEADSKKKRGHPL